MKELDLDEVQIYNEIFTDAQIAAASTPGSIIGDADSVPGKAQLVSLLKVNQFTKL